jgi:hypothetical protein
MRSNARRRVIEGPFGSGKSVGCCVEIFRRCCEQAASPDGVRRSRWAVIRNTYPDLKNTTVKTWQAWFGSEFGQFVNVAPFEHRLRFPLGDETRVEADVIFLALDQPDDAKKFLSLELTGIYFNEVRELRREIIEAGDGRIGRYPSMKDGGPSWYGIIADTNMPDEDHWLYELAEKTKSPGWEFYLQPGGVMKVDGNWVLNPEAENLQNLVPDYYTGQLEGKSEDWIAVHLGAQYGRLATEGSYYHEELATAEQQRRIGTVIIDPGLPVHTFWDLGVSDSTVIWFGQVSMNQWRWVDYYENSGKGLDHYAKVLREKREEHRFEYGTHVWPHDGTSRELSADGAPRRCDVMAGLGFPVEVLERSHVGDGIDAARMLIRTSWFDKERCADGLRHLRRYRRAFSKVRNVFLEHPEHDEHSHAADGFRTAAMGKGKVSNGSWSSGPLKLPDLGIV